MALLLIAAAAAGYNTGFAWLDSQFGNGGGGIAAGGAGSNGGGGGGGGDGTAAGGGCFLGIICADASANADGTSGGATVDDEGIDVDG